MLAVARQKVRQAEAGRWVDLVCGNAFRLPVRGRSVDAIFMSFTLELFGPDEVPEVLAECSRTLTPGGRIAIASVSAFSPQGGADEVQEWTRFPTLVDCRPLPLGQIIASAGFRVTDRVIDSLRIPTEIVVAKIAGYD